MGVIHYKVFELEIIVDCYCQQILHPSKKFERKFFRKIVL